MSDKPDAQKTAEAFLVILAPFLLVGAVLTISLFGAVFGLPLLLVAVPSALIAWRVRSSPSDHQVGPLRIASAFFAVVLTIALIATIAVGFDDLDTAIEWAGLALASTWVGAAWWIASRSRLLQSALRSAAETGGP